MIVVNKDSMKFVFDSKKEFNKFAFLEVLKNDKKLHWSKRKIEKTTVFELMTDYGYDYVAKLIKTKQLNVPLEILWSDEKSQNTHIFRFKDEKWNLMDEKFPTHLMFNKFETLLAEHNFFTVVSH